MVLKVLIGISTGFKHVQYDMNVYVRVQWCTCQMGAGGCYVIGGSTTGGRRG